MVVCYYKTMYDFRTKRALGKVPSDCDIFNCTGITLGELPRELPVTLIKLFCIGNSLTTLPEFPYLTVLNCSDNCLQELPKLSESLIILECIANRLTELPKLPDTLKELECANNYLFVLPELPISLIKLACSCNNLTELPELPISLKKCFCRENNIKYLSPHNCNIIKQCTDLEIIKNPFSIDFTSSKDFVDSL